jgi:hypothetical protein
MSFMGDAITNQLETYLAEIMGHRSKIFRKLLLETGSVIAGGFVLSACTDKGIFISPDIDVYVPVENCRVMLEFIFGAMNNYKVYEKGRFASYCETFISKNRIRTLYRHKATYSSAIQKDMDIMAVRKDTTPVEVVKKFDLTFCQVWYDGKGVYASHPEDVLSKSGTIRGPYLNTFLNSNSFLIKRYKKYIERGFTINLEIENGEYEIFDESVPKITKLKFMTDEQINEAFDTDEKKRKFVTKILFRILTKNTDDCEYDSDDYDSPATLGKDFGSAKIEKAIVKFLKISGSNKKTSKLLVSWYNTLCQ